MTAPAMTAPALATSADEELRPRFKGPPKVTLRVQHHKHDDRGGAVDADGLIVFDVR